MPLSKNTLRDKYPHLPCETSIDLTDPSSEVKKQLREYQRELVAERDEIKRRELIEEAVKLLCNFQELPGPNGLYKERINPGRKNVIWEKPGYANASVGILYRARLFLLLCCSSHWVLSKKRK